MAGPLNMSDVRCRRMSCVAQLSPGKAAAQQVVLLPWVALPARTKDVTSLLPPAARQFVSFPMGPQQGNVCAWSVLSLRAGPERPLHAGDEQGRDVAAELLLRLLAVPLRWPRGFPRGPALQVSDVEWPTRPSCSSEVSGVCLLLKWPWLRSCWVRRLCAWVLCGSAWPTVCF